MDTEKLRKLASLLRHEANRVNSTKQQKLANITLASASLELLRRKIYG